MITFVCLSLVLLILLYPIVIQYNRGGFFKLLLPLLFLAIIADIIANYTILIVLMLDVPQEGEYTFSKRLERLVLETGIRGKICLVIAKILNWFDPSHNHIKNAMYK